MLRRLFVLAGGAAALLLLAAPLGASAQQPHDSIRAEALRDYHGPDLEGKDGPLAKAGLDLLVLYHEYRAFQREGGDAFAPSASGIRVSEGHVTIDAIAASDAQQLRSDLKGLGTKDVERAGRVVSGRVPIGRIPELARLESLRGVTASRMQTQDRGTAPPHPQPKAMPSDSGDHASSPPASQAPEEPSNDPGGVALLFLVGVLFILLLTEL